jgi:hypothetical protein
MRALQGVTAAHGRRLLSASGARSARHLQSRLGRQRWKHGAFRDCIGGDALATQSNASSANVCSPSRVLLTPAGRTAPDFDLVGNDEVPAARLVAADGLLIDRP